MQSWALGWEPLGFSTVCNTMCRSAVSLSSKGSTLGRQKSAPATVLACDPGLGMEPLHQVLAQGPPCPLPRLCGKGLLAFPCHQTQAAHDSVTSDIPLTH